MTSPHHLLTVAVEDYFQTAGLAPWIGVDRWSRLESRVEVGTRRTLDLLDEFGIHATFFVLGWVAERAPGLVREISARGHEIASKGYLPRYFRTM
ncbi:MAG TPA: polysaccharide deacetylase family protein, partial [Myxococcota bacterium]|nr:polysaccharide deacetylase family protein [Myxococcota bacterium]